MKGDSGEPGLPGLPGEDAFVPIDYIKCKYRETNMSCFVTISNAD